MKYSIVRRYVILTSLLVLMVLTGQVCASSQWPYPRSSYPRDVAYLYSFLQKLCENSKFDVGEKQKFIDRVDEMSVEEVSALIENFGMSDPAVEVAEKRSQ